MRYPFIGLVALLAVALNGCDAAVAPRGKEPAATPAGEQIETPSDEVATDTGESGGNTANTNFSPGVTPAAPPTNIISTTAGAPYLIDAYRLIYGDVEVREQVVTIGLLQPVFWGGSGGTRAYQYRTKVDGNLGSWLSVPGRHPTEAEYYADRFDSNPRRLWRWTYSSLPIVSRGTVTYYLRATRNGRGDPNGTELGSVEIGELGPVKVSNLRARQRSGHDPGVYDVQFQLAETHLRHEGTVVFFYTGADCRGWAMSTGGIYHGMRNQLNRNAEEAYWNSRDSREVGIRVQINGESTFGECVGARLSVW